MSWILLNTKTDILFGLEFQRRVLTMLVRMEEKLSAVQAVVDPIDKGMDIKTVQNIEELDDLEHRLEDDREFRRKLV